MLPSRALSAQACQEPAIPRSKSHPQEKVLDDQDSLSHSFSSVALESQKPVNQPEHLQGKLLWYLDLGAAGGEKSEACVLKIQDICVHQHTLLCPLLL